MQTVTLNNGAEMPVLGFGVFQVPEEETEQAVSSALKAGYRSLDTAQAYQNEAAVGRAIASSGIPRDELFITTKLWVQDPGDEDNTLRAFDRSLQRLGLDHVDLYLIHQPYGDYYSEWRALRHINAAGRASQDFDLTDTDMAEIAALDTGETQFFDHHDPQWVRSLGTRRIS
jgi:2,5-diketo-D-gluconate reductase A